jgi:hypothetical protein
LRKKLLLPSNAPGKLSIAECALKKNSLGLAVELKRQLGQAFRQLSRQKTLAGLVWLHLVAPEVCL